METNNKRKKGSVTLRVYNAAKIMFKAGAKNKEVAEYLEISEVTASRIKNSQDYEDYKNIQRAAWYGAHKREVEKKAQEELEKEQQKQEELKKQQEEEEAKKRLAEKKPQQGQQPFVQTVTVQATHYMMEELREMNKVLTLISNKLTFIVEQLQ